MAQNKFLSFCDIDSGKTIVIVTHEHDIAAMTNRNIHLKDGFVVDEEVKIPTV